VSPRRAAARQHTGGHWSPGDAPALFLVMRVSDDICDELARGGHHAWWLTPANDHPDERGVERLGRALDAGCRTLLDSGVFSLASAHARARSMELPDVLQLPPDHLDGYDELRRQYVRLVKTYEPRLWGYIEHDLGGREVKRRNRAALEAEGLRPIPVWHPFSDGAAYFDELAERYDRICVGNFVFAPPAVRVRLLHWLWERRRRYPGVWIHALGVAPWPALFGVPCDSVDTSSWESLFRRGSGTERALLHPAGDTQAFAPTLGADAGAPNGHQRALKLAGAAAVAWQRAWTRWHNEQVELLGITQPPRMRTASSTLRAGVAPGHSQG